MQIEATTAKLIATVREKQKDYESGFLEATERYFSKVGEYADYVAAAYSGGATEPLQSPPYPPTYYGNEFNKTLDFLSLHAKRTLVLTQDEFARITDNINTWISVGISGYGNTMSGTIFRVS